MSLHNIKKALRFTLLIVICGIVICAIRTLKYGSQLSSRPELQSYSFHPSCNCSRIGPRLSSLHPPSSNIDWRDLEDGTFVGPSTCNEYTSALGSGQNVLSYTYYTPWRSSGAKVKSNGRPNDQSGSRYAELLFPLARTIKVLYPGWRMRIYHNVTEDQTGVRMKFKCVSMFDPFSQVLSRMCKLYCNNPHVDLCDTRNLPSVGNLNEDFSVGRFWRFQALGDPTVRMFGSRDVDSWILPRERAAVQDWQDNGQ